MNVILIPVFLSHFSSHLVVAFNRLSHSEQLMLRNFVSVFDISFRRAFNATYAVLIVDYVSSQELNRSAFPLFFHDYRPQIIVVFDSGLAFIGLFIHPVSGYLLSITVFQISFFMFQLPYYPILNVPVPEHFAQRFHLFFVVLLREETHYGSWSDD